MTRACARVSCISQPRKCTTPPPDAAAVRSHAKHLNQNDFRCDPGPTGHNSCDDELNCAAPMSQTQKGRKTMFPTSSGNVRVCIVWAATSKSCGIVGVLARHPGGIKPQQKQRAVAKRTSAIVPVFTEHKAHSPAQTGTSRNSLQKAKRMRSTDANKEKSSSQSPGLDTHW